MLGSLAVTAESLSPRRSGRLGIFTATAAPWGIARARTGHEILSITRSSRHVSNEREQERFGCETLQNDEVPRHAVSPSENNCICATVTFKLRDGLRVPEARVHINIYRIASAVSVINYRYCCKLTTVLV